MKKIKAFFYICLVVFFLSINLYIFLVVGDLNTKQTQITMLKVFWLVFPKETQKIKNQAGVKMLS